jgi:predicted acyl esterase
MTIPQPTPGANAIFTSTRLENLVFDKNVDIPLKDGGVCRANVYKPLTEGRYPVLMTMGPYGKDVPYSQFHVKSFREIPDEQKGPLSAWETPHPDVSVCSAVKMQFRSQLPL